MKISIIILLLLFTGCSIHQLSLDDGDSEIFIDLAGWMQKAQVSLNGEQVFDKKNVKIIQLQNLEDGVYDIHVTVQHNSRSGDVDYKQTVTLTGGRYQIEVDTPPFTSVYYVLMGAQ